MIQSVVGIVILKSRIEESDLKSSESSEVKLSNVYISNARLRYSNTIVTLIEHSPSL